MNLNDWRVQRASKDTQGQTIQEVLDQRKQAKSQTLEEVRDTATEQRNLDKLQLIDDVLLSARLTQQNEMIEQIKNGAIVDEVVKRYQSAN